MNPPLGGDCRRGRFAAEFLSKRIALPTRIAVTTTTPMRLRIVNCTRANRIDSSSCSTAKSDLQSIDSICTNRFTPDCACQPTSPKSHPPVLRVLVPIPYGNSVDSPESTGIPGVRTLKDNGCPLPFDLIAVLLGPPRKRGRGDRPVKPHVADESDCPYKQKRQYEATHGIDSLYFPRFCSLTS
jgi:hypothetical protein